MKRQDDRWGQRVILKKNENLAYYVEAQDTGLGGDGFVSSLVEIVTAKDSEVL